MSLSILGFQHQQSEFLLALAEDNVVAQLENIQTHPTVAAQEAEGDLVLHGWVYHIVSGKVTVYNEASQMFDTTASS